MFVTSSCSLAVPERSWLLFQWRLRVGNLRVVFDEIIARIMYGRLLRDDDAALEQLTTAAKLADSTGTVLQSGIARLAVAERHPDREVAARHLAEAKEILREARAAVWVRRALAVERAAADV